MVDKGSSTLTPKNFLEKVLAGTAQGTIIALIPNAILGAVLKYFNYITIIQKIIDVGVIFQLATPLIIGALISNQFNLSPAKMMITGGAAFAGAGVITYDTQAKAYIVAGTGDIINIMITASVAIIFMLLIGNKFGSVEIIAMPVVVGAGAGFIGMLTYPLVTQITFALGTLINNFTEFQPIIMSIFISCSFAALIISPITTVGIGLAIGLNGMTAGAASMGIASAMIVLVIYSWKVNESGITLAIALGGMKLMMPNLFKYPIILLPILFTATLSSISVVLFNISGTPQSSGFGLVGLVGPLASMDAGLNILLLILSWFVIPILVGLFSKLLFEKTLKLYDSHIVFAYQG